MRTLSRRGFFTILAGAGTATATAGQAIAAAAAWLVMPEPAPQQLRQALPHNGLAEPETFRTVGTVIEFDHYKGYGFVVPDGGGQKIPLHISCLRAHGYHTVRAGARVECDVLRRPKGQQVYHIVELVGSTESGPDTAHVAVAAESQWEKASVKWFNHMRGFGFLTRGEGTPDIFVHLETLQNAGMAKLRPGQFVQVRWGRGRKGLTAAELRPHWL